MAVFVVVVLTEKMPNGIEHELETAFAGKHMNVAQNVWLVSMKDTAKALSDQLGISEGNVGTGMVAAVGSYFGRASPVIWDWIKVQQESE